MAISGSIDPSFITSYADRLIIYPQFLFLLVGVILSIQVGHGHLLSKVRKESDRARSVIHAQKSRDEMDHTRLLKVIEREREIMEELRARESERTEQMRAAKNMADEANQSKSAFLAVVSHEIRTPMTGLIGMLRMLENTTLSKDQKEYLDVIKDSSDTMLALLNDILDFSKIEKGVLDLENIEFDLKRVLMAVNTLMKTHADQKNIALNLIIDPDMPHTIYGDPTRLRQVFLNLVGNALKFTSNGHVTVKADLKTLDEKQCVVDFAIEDTGIGISKEAQENLFAPFAQADSSITRKYGGTGLGLAICKTLVEAMGGNITLKSTEGIGTTFYFTLAFALKSDVQIKKDVLSTSSTTTAITPMNILVVDDNEVNAKVISEFLKEDKHTTTHAISGKECLDIMQSQSNFDIILVDIEMPGMSGVELAEIIIKNPDTKHIPLIAMTGNIGLSDVELYQEKGFKGLVGKPFEPEKIKILLANVQNAPDQAHFDKIKSNTSSSAEKTSHTEKDEKKKTKPVKKPSIGKALDDMMLTNLKNGLGTQKTQDLLEETFIKADSIIQQMLEAINDNDKKSIYARAHELKGMCANFGLKAISEKALEIETATKIEDYDIDDFNPHVEDLKTLLERSKIAVDKFFGK
jgi:signal transduction histidine kinase/CheY-like chemotaxis protein